MRFSNEALLSAANALTDQTSAAFDASYALCGSVMGVATGATAAGTLKVQASNDMPLPGRTPTSWFDVTGLTVSIAAAGVVAIPKFDICYQWLRLVFTQSGGANNGTITARLKTTGF